jgi:hypothetical protein
VSGHIGKNNFLNRFKVAGNMHGLGVGLWDLGFRDKEERYKGEWETLFQFSIHY